MRKLTFAFDVDEVLADLLSEWLRRYNADYNDTLTRDSLDRWSMADQVKPECGKKVYDYLKDPTLYCFVRPYLYARQAVRDVREEGHDVLFVSSCVIGSYDDKARWLVRNDFGTVAQIENEFIPARQKHRVNADVLIDDHVENVEKYPGLALLVTRPHNAKLETSRVRIRGAHEALHATYRAMGMAYPDEAAA